MPHRSVAPPTRIRARALRSDMTIAESRLWYRLRAHRLGHSFRRQVPVGKYVVDFLCLKARVAIEVDGGQHADNQRDAARDAWLESQGFVVLRFWNNDVLNNLEGVLERIAKTLKRTLPPSLTLPRKGGGNRPRQDVRPQQDTRPQTGSETSAHPHDGFTSPLAGEVGSRSDPGGG